MLVLLICSLLAVILLLPVLIQSSVYRIDKMTMTPLQDDTDEQRSSGSPFPKPTGQMYIRRFADLHGTTLSKCVFDSDAMFTLYTFMIGFAFPAILITLFYSRVRSPLLLLLPPRQIFLVAGYLQGAAILSQYARDENHSWTRKEGHLHSPCAAGSDLLFTILEMFLVVKEYLPVPHRQYPTSSCVLETLAEDRPSRHACCNNLRTRA